MVTRTVTPKCKYHPNAYEFIFSALRHTQKKFDRDEMLDPEDEESHISGPELLDGIRELALERFGLLARTVFSQWGIKATDDFGHMVFEMIEKGHMRKTDRDRLEDFFAVYDFVEVFDNSYTVDVSNAFLIDTDDDSEDDDSDETDEFDSDDEFIV